MSGSFNLSGKHIVVVGLGQTGDAVIAAALARNAIVTATDTKSKDQCHTIIKKYGDAVCFDLGGHTLDYFLTADLIVVSPGIAINKHPEILAAQQADIEVISEIELAFRLFDQQATLIAITGTNGKTTTTTLTAALCRQAGPTFCGGNHGDKPLITALDHPANTHGGFIVSEIAGFMLETCVDFRPTIAACLNISDDHLDRFETLENYAAVKTSIFKNQTSTDTAIFNHHCSYTNSALKTLPSKSLSFSSQEKLSQGAYLSDNQLILRCSSNLEEEIYSLNDLPLIGTHNAENAMAAYLCARAAGVTQQQITEGAKTFKPCDHRMQFIGTYHDVHYYNDSKGTNVAASTAALSGFNKPVVLIAGGVDKGGSYIPLLNVLDSVARGVVLLGESYPKILAAMKNHNINYPVIIASDINDAVLKANKLSKPGDAVILSPACSSYDMFSNFEERGTLFCEAVKHLCT